MLRPSPWAQRAMDLFDGVRCYVGDVQAGASFDSATARPFRFAVFPAGDANVASARLRSLPLLSLMAESSIRSAVGPSWIPAQRPDVAWFQKKLTAGRLRTAARLKASGCRIVYDCDESGSDLDYWALPALASEMLDLVDVVTTDTPERGHLLRELAPSCRVQVLENQVDFGNSISIAETSTALHGDTLRVLWFGHGSNLESLSAYRDELVAARGIRLVLCGPRRSEIRRALGNITADVRPWSRRKFPEILTTCDVTLLSHFGSRHDAAKSAHKMITSICHGVPALVSATPDYSRVAKFAGVFDDAVYSSPQQLEVLMQRMKSPELRREYIKRSRNVLLERYGPGSFCAAAALLLSVLTPAASPAYVAH